MTKFILHGGFTRVDNELNTAYYQAITADLADSSQILVILFAREEADYLDRLAKETKQLNRSSPKKQFQIIPASEQNLIEQIKQSQAIVISGGDTNKLISAIKKHPSFANAIKGKVIAGSSAGAQILSTYYHSSNTGEVRPGLGLLPLRVICHYQSDQFDVTEKAIAAMNEYSNDHELVVLKDYEWKVFTQ